jgi:hypothetical protein
MFFCGSQQCGAVYRITAQQPVDAEKENGRKFYTNFWQGLVTTDDL